MKKVFVLKLKTSVVVCATRLSRLSFLSSAGISRMKSAHPALVVCSSLWVSIKTFARIKFRVFQLSKNNPGVLISPDDLDQDPDDGITS